MKSPYPQQAGVVLVFKMGITPEQAEKALERLKDVIDPDYYVGGKANVQTFNPQWGGPVFYVP